MVRDVLETHVRGGTVPGAVALVARGADVRIEAAGWADVDGEVPMAPDTIVRIASVTKPITAAALMMLVDDGRVGLDDPVARWLPELASPTVVRTPSSPVDDLVTAVRPITVADILESRAGYGFPTDFSLPGVQPLLDEVEKDPPPVSGPDEWMATLSRVPMLHQPGEAWLYNTCSDIQGVLIARASGRSFPDFLAERVFEPLGMVDTGFVVAADKLVRFAAHYRGAPGGGLDLAEAPGGRWTTMPAFPSGAGGLVSTAGDWHRFARMLLGGGTVDGRHLLSRESVRRMTTDHLTAAQREAGRLFLEGQGWGYGGSVDVEAVDPWNVPGRYGWIGGTGTAAHITPSTGAVTILLTQVEMTGPTAPPVMGDFWRCAVSHGR